MAEEFFPGDLENLAAGGSPRTDARPALAAKLDRKMALVERTGVSSGGE